MSAQNPSATIILLNYHDLENTLECLASLKNQQVVVVNIHDAKEKPDQQAVEAISAYPNVRLVEHQNAGFSGGNNVGASFAIEHDHPEYLIFLNNDTRVAPDAISSLVSFAQQHAGTLAAYAPKIYFEPGYEFHKSSYLEKERGNVLWYAGGLVDRKNMYAWHRGVDEVDHGQFDTPIETGFLTGCCFMIATADFQRLGGWNEKYFLYLEDLEYSERIKKRGGQLWYVPSAVVWHKNAGSNGGSGSDTQLYYQTRNRLFFGLRYASMRTKLALVKESVKKIIKSTHIERKALIDGFIGKMGKK